MKKYAIIFIIFTLLFLSACVHSDIGESQNNSTSLTYDWQSAYANYSGDVKLFASGLNADKMYESKELHLPIYKFDDRKKLIDFRDDLDDILTFDQGYDEIPSFDDAVEKYDEDFFENNCLFIVYVQAGSGSHRYGVSEIYSDLTFQVRITELNSPEVVTCDMAGWFIMVEVNKEDIKGCVNFDAVMR